MFFCSFGPESEQHRSLNEKIHPYSASCLRQPHIGNTGRDPGFFFFLCWSPKYVSKPRDAQAGVDRHTRFLCKRPGSCGSWVGLQGGCFVKALRPVPPIRVICTLPDVLTKAIYETQGGTLSISFVLECKLVSVLYLSSESQTCMKHRAAPWPFFYFSE